MDSRLFRLSGVALAGNSENAGKGRKLNLPPIGHFLQILVQNRKFEIIEEQRRLADGATGFGSWRVVIWLLSRGSQSHAPKASPT